MANASAVAGVWLSARICAAPSSSPAAVVRLSHLARSEPRFTLSLCKALSGFTSPFSSTYANLRFNRGCFIGRQLDFTRSSSWGFSRSAALGLGATVCALGFICGGPQPGALPAALSALGVLNAALLVHEAGHLAAARALRVAVREFSVGIGPRVAWWQGPTTTYSLRAVPLAGYVSFLTPAYLWSHTTTAALAPGLRLLEDLSAGRRAVVTVAGVVANVALAAAIVAWQVVSHGHPLVVARPGALIRTAQDWEGEVRGEEAAGQLGGGGRGATGATDPRLKAGDVVLAVGNIRLPTGGDVTTAFVEALHAADAASRRGTTATTTACAADSDGSAAAAAISAVQTYRNLANVKMTVLRVSTALAGEYGGGTGSTAAAGTGAGGGPRLVDVAALDALRYGTLIVGPNLAVGFVRPNNLREGVDMTINELRSWMCAIMTGWRQALGASSSSGVSSSISSATATASGAQWVGPLGLVAAVTAAVVEQQQQLAAVEAPTAALGASGRTRSGECGAVEESSDYTYSFSCGLPSARTAPSVAQDDATATASSSPATDNSRNGDGSSLLYDVDCAILHDQVHASDSLFVREPSYLAAMGVQVNLQLAAFNLLPLPILDGGQLMLITLEALRGGRRLPPSLERGALLASGPLLGCWMAALSAGDVVALADGAAGRLAAGLE